jgi:integrase
MRLTDKAIRALTLPDGALDKTFFDDDVPGFGVRVRAGGSKVFVVQYNNLRNQTRRYSLGSVTTLDQGKARAEAKDLLARVRLGEDPFATKLEARHKAGHTFGASLPAFLEAKRTGIGAERKLSPRWHGQVTGLLETVAKPLHGLPVRDITRAQVADLLTKVAQDHGAGQANRFRAVLSAYFSWLIGAGRADTNVVSGTNKPAAEKARDRTPSDAELAAIWKAAGSDHFGDIVRLLILTGARRTEIGDLRWSEIDLEQQLIALPASRVKNGRPHEIPLTALALEILARQSRHQGRDQVFGYGEGGFQGWGKSKAGLDARLPGVAQWTLHDIRRAVSTGMHERLGVAPHIVEAVLGHISGHRAGVAGTYNRALYRDDKRAALEKWTAHIMELVTDKKAPQSKVVKLRRA